MYYVPNQCKSRRRENIVATIGIDRTVQCSVGVWCIFEKHSKLYYNLAKSFHFLLLFNYITEHFWINLILKTLSKVPNF